MIAVIPAAGRGTRLGSITTDRPKALVPVGARPVMFRVIDSITAAGIETIVVVVGHMGGQVVEAVSEAYPDMDIRFTDQEQQNGTAGALLTAQTHAAGGPFLYSWADLVAPPTAFEHVVAAWTGDSVVLAVDRHKDPTAGAAVTVVDGAVEAIVEKPAPGTFSTPFNASGVGILTGDAWPYLNAVIPSRRGELELTSALQSMLADDRPVRAVEIGPVFDMGTPEGLASADAWVTEAPFVEDAKHTWNAEARCFDAEPDHGLRDAPTRRAWVSLLESWLPPPPARVADLGCGTGSLSIEAARLGHRVTGVDVADEMVRMARHKADRDDVEVEFVVGDAGWPPLRDSEFDAVLVRHVAWALPAPERAIARWKKLLRPGGRLVMVEGVWKSSTTTEAPGVPWAGGVSATVLAQTLERHFASVEHHSLSDDPVLWGGPVDDERYGIVAIDPV